MKILSIYIIYFFLYSFLGWICETTYCSIGHKKYINRGFLNGPLCPIYGFGALMIILLLNNYQESVYILFIYSMISTSILEYITGILLETLFHTKWWDYSEKKFNIHGRVCLRNSILFGIMGVFLTRIAHKKIAYMINLIPLKVIYFLSISLLCWIAIEIIVTLNALNKLTIKLKSIGEVLTELESINIKLDKLNLEDVVSKINEVKNKDEYIEKYRQEKLEDIKNNITGIKTKASVQKRIFKAFPRMKHKKYNEQLEYLITLLKEKSK